MNHKILSLLIISVAVSVMVSCNDINNFPKETIQETVPNTKIFRLADNQPDGYPTVLGDLKFAELVSKRSGGELQIEVYNNGQLGNEINTIEQLQFGAIDFLRVSTNGLATINDKMNALSMPYLYRDKEHLYRVLDSSIGNEYLEILSDNNMIGLSWFTAGSRSFYNSKKPIRTPEDMKGLRIRTQESQLMMDLVSSLGAIPAQMAYNEVYAGIEADVIDGAENNLPSYMSQSHNEAALYFTINEHTSTPEMLLINKTVFDQLTEEQQLLLKECAKEAALYQREEWARQEKEYEETAIETGSIIIHLTEEELFLFREAAAPVYDRYPQYADIVQRIRHMELIHNMLGED